MSTLKVGDTIWKFDQNRRVYPKAAPGRIWPDGGPIWREHWRQVEITGETRVSWLTGWGKCPKKGRDVGVWAFTQLEIDEQTYVHDHAYRIADAVKRCQDPNALRTIADIVGYKP